MVEAIAAGAALVLVVCVLFAALAAIVTMSGPLPPEEPPGFLAGMYGASRVLRWIAVRAGAASLVVLLASLGLMAFL